MRRWRRRYEVPLTFYNVASRCFWEEQTEPQGHPRRHGKFRLSRLQINLHWELAQWGHLDICWTLRIHRRTYGISGLSYWLHHIRGAHLCWRQWSDRLHLFGLRRRLYLSLCSTFNRGPGRSHWHIQCRPSSERAELIQRTCVGKWKFYYCSEWKSDNKFTGTELRNL